MKNKILKILGFIILILVIKSTLPLVCFNIGKNAYNKQDYLKAHKYLYFAVKSNKYNKNYRFYYINTLKRLPKLLNIQKEIYTIAVTDIPDNANLIANQYVEEIRHAFKKKPQYIDKVTINSSVMHWNKQPIRVEVNTSNPEIPMYFYREIINAFNTWQYKTDSNISFLFNNIAPDIVIEFENREIKTETKDYVVAYTEPEYDDNKLQKIKITFYNKNNLNEQFSSIDIYNIALHEIGHALGIMGHSEDQNDIMYMKTNSDNPELGLYRKTLTERDINTFNLLYKLCPDISNDSCSDEMIYAPIILGDADLRNHSKLQEALNYTKEAPELPLGYIDLADAYLQLKNYAKAEEALKKAAELATNDTNTPDINFIVNYNLAVLYTEIQDYKKAIEFANIAKSYKDNITPLIGMIYYSSGDYERAIAEYEILVKHNPSNIFYSSILAQSYIKQKKFIQAGKVLNNLVKNNPKAKNNSYVKRYKLLMFFVK